MLLALLTLALDLHQPMRIPPHFEPNQGQVAGETEWIAKAPGGTLYIKSTAIAFATADPGKKPRILRFVGARPVKGEGLDPSGGYSNYFTGRDEKNWRSGIPHFSQVRYKGLYKGIDLVYYGTQDRQIEYDLEVQPGADIRQIDLAFEGFDKAELNADGDLLIRHGKYVLTQRRPKVVQDGNLIACTYKKRGHHWGLALDSHDETRMLTIDPVLDFATYLGGPGEDEPSGISVDSSGFIYVFGETQTPNGPGLNPFQQPNLIGYTGFIAKFSPNADQLIFFTAFLTNGVTNASFLAVDHAGNSLVTGATYATDFPIKNAFQSQMLGPWSGFITKFSSDGRTILWSSFFGGSKGGAAGGGALDANDDVILGGATNSTDIPIVNAFQPNFAGGSGDCVLAKVSNAGKLVFSTYFGGSSDDSCNSPVLDQHGNIWLGGQSSSTDFPLKNPIQATLSPRGGSGFQTALIAEFSSDGQQLKYATFLGGGGTGGTAGIALNSKDEILGEGFAYNGQWTIVNAYQPTCEADICLFMMKLDPTGQQVLTSTFFGGTGRTTSSGIKVGSDDTVYIAGRASSPDFPVLNSLEPPRQDMSYTNSLAFVARFTSDLKTLIYSTLLGGSRDQQCCVWTLDAQNRVDLLIFTSSPDNTVVNAFQPIFGGDYDIYFARISDSTAAVSNPVSATPGQIILHYVQGATPPPPQTVMLSGPAGTYTATADAAWVTINPQSGTIPGNLQIAAPILAPGQYSSNVTITPNSGAPVIVAVTLNVLFPAPALTSVKPPFVPIGSDDTLVTFHGSGFTSQTTLLLGTTPYDPPATFVDSQTLQVTMPWESFASTGTYQFSVLNPGSAVSQTVVLSVGGASPSITSVVNAASLQQGPIAPGELLTITGSNFGTSSQLSVTIGGLPATIVQNIGANQIIVLVPTLGLFGSSASIQLQSGALTSAPLNLPLAPTAPGLFTADMSGKGPALIQGIPSPGSTITLFGTGVADLTQTFTATINGAIASVGSVSAVPNQPGWFQLSVTIPAEVPNHSPQNQPPRPSAASVVISVGGQQSQPGVTLALQVAQ